MMKCFRLNKLIAKQDQFTVRFLRNDPEGFLHFGVPGLVNCEEALTEGGKGGVKPGCHVNFGVGKEGG